MDLDELRAMKEKMEQNMAAQMESMKGMMQNLPPEARAAMEQMSSEKEKAPSEVKATGKSKTINGFPCKEYRAISNDEQEQAWVTSNNPAVKAAFYEIANAMPMDDETDKKWEIADGWPVQNSHIRARQGYVEGSFSISETYSLEEVTHKAGTFDPPAGFKKRTMQDMMQGMQQMPGNLKVE